jgi:hypothetical protein
MNPLPSSDPVSPAFSFTSGASTDCTIDWKMTLLGPAAHKIWPVRKPARVVRREAVELPFIEPMIKCRYSVDDFGRPRILSRFEAMLYALARPVVLGVILGYGVAIATVGIPHLLASPGQNVAQHTAPVRIAAQEDLP